MAFFEDLSKKLSQVGQSAVQKTKEVTDIARLNGSISDEEKKINNNYYQIGKLFVARHGADCGEDFAGMIAAIKESEQKIADYRQQIQQIKGVVRCEKCGAEVSGNVAFCSACGAPMPKAAPVDENLVKCPGCGQMVAKNMRFCTSCGKAMTEQPAPVEPTPAEPAQAPMCPGCGAAVEPGLAFCTECGTKL